MRKIENLIRMVVGLFALLIIAPQSATGQEKKQALLPLEKKNATSAQLSKRPVADEKLHRLILQVNTNEPAMMILRSTTRRTSRNITRTSARR